MNTALSSLSRLFTSTRRAAYEPDAGDMGTCFGLEMSLQRDPAPLESEWTAGAGGPARETEPPAPAERRFGWRRRGDRPAPKDPLAA